MKIRRHIGDYNFIADQESGMTFRWGKTMEDNPKFAPVPELVDISISNHCTKGCDYCYRDSKDNNSFLSVEDYRFLLECLNHPKYGNVFQVALGGGEPLEHPNFVELINLTREFNVIPNFTTNGIHLSEPIIKQIKGKVGAVAISINDLKDLEGSNINLLIEEGIRTNIHYVLNQSNINQAIEILSGKFNSKLEGVNAIIFLTYKPAGRGDEQFALKLDDNIRRFIELIDNNTCSCNIGFDACFVPLLMHFTETNKDVIDFCEVGYFSVYVDEKLNVTPCSFSGGKDGFSLREFDFYDIWLNKFSEFRSKINNECSQVCSAHKECKGKCSYYPDITICYK